MLIPYKLKHSVRNENGSSTREVWLKTCEYIK